MGVEALLLLLLRHRVQAEEGEGEVHPCPAVEAVERAAPLKIDRVDRAVEEGEEVELHLPGQMVVVVEAVAERMVLMVPTDRAGEVEAAAVPSK